MKPLPTTFRFVVLCVLAAAALPAHAGSFQVNPVRIDLGASTLSAAVTVRNDGADPVVLQTSILAWTQANGKDEYQPTSDALATPPLATIAAGGQQIVRVGLRRAPDPRNELAFRMYVQEIPGSERPGFSGLQVALRVGIPVFVAPVGPVLRKLDWKAALRPDGQLELSVENRGNVHLRMVGMTLRSPTNEQELARENGLAYVLPGQSRTWLLKLSGMGPELRTVVLHLFGDAGESDETVPLAR